MTQAEQNSILALELIRQSGNKVALGQALGQLANIKLMQRATQEGFALFEEALAVLEQTESTEYLKQICMRYALALEKIGDLPKAIKFFKQAFYYQNQEHNKER
jgi:tetratricopeptide (TPR) repeat protein